MIHYTQTDQKPVWKFYTVRISWWVSSDLQLLVLRYIWWPKLQNPYYRDSKALKKLTVANLRWSEIMQMLRSSSFTKQEEEVAGKERRSNTEGRARRKEDDDERFTFICEVPSGLTRVCCLCQDRMWKDCITLRCEQVWLVRPLLLDLRRHESSLKTWTSLIFHLQLL